MYWEFTLLFLLIGNYRRLCILKGVFPREPKKKVRGNHHTYYHLKDILFVKHDPLLEKFREMRTYEKKIKKAEAKKNKDLYERLRTRKPTYTLDRLILERFVEYAFLLSTNWSFHILSDISWLLTRLM